MMTTFQKLVLAMAGFTVSVIGSGILLEPCPLGSFFPWSSSADAGALNTEAKRKNLSESL